MATATNKTAGASGTVIKRAKDFASSGRYVVTFANGRSVRIYRDTFQFSFAIWYVVNDENTRDFTRAELVAKLEATVGALAPRKPARRFTHAAHGGRIVCNQRPARALGRTDFTYVRANITCPDCVSKIEAEERANPCPSCKGAKECPACVGGVESCATCKGSGDCPTCEATGIDPAFPRML